MLGGQRDRNFPAAILYPPDMSRLAPAVVSLIVLVVMAMPAFAQERSQTPRVLYTLTLDQPQTQMVSVSVLIGGVEGEHIDLMLPIWRPGRYVVMNQAQSIRDFKAFGDQDKPLAVTKTDKATWRIALDGSKSVRAEYFVYCNSLGDRMRHVDDSHAFLDGASVFMYAPQTRDWQCRVRIVKPRDWDIACGLETTPRRDNTLVAPDYDTLIDCPLEIGVHDVIDFEASGKPHQIVIWGEADEKPEELKRDFTKIVEEQTKIFGSSPYERYVFLIHAGAAAGGGTEHVNSTIMQTTRAALEEPAAYQRFLSLVSHEFFHTWNIKSFRPAGLIPYDYQRENYTDLLWVAEGTTSYYAPLVLVRAGFTQPARYLDSLADSIDAMRNKPGDLVQSVAQASFDSWIHYGVRTPDDANSTVDFYGKGSLVSLLLDLEMRRRSEGKADLDDVMRTLYERFPLKDKKGYTTDDLQRIVEELSSADFDDVFARHVRGAQAMDFERAFEAVGVELYFRPASESENQTGSARGGRGGRGARAAAGGTGEGDRERLDESPPPAPATGDDQPASAPQSRPAEPRMKAYLGLNLSDGGAIAAPVGSSSSAATLPPAPLGKTTVTSVLSDGPAYAAGLLPGDEILALDGRRLTAATLDARLRSLKPGEEISITYFRREQLRSVKIKLAGKPDGRWAIRKMRDASDAQKAAYEAWLGQAW